MNEDYHLLSPSGLNLFFIYIYSNLYIYLHLYTFIHSFIQPTNQLLNTHYIYVYTILNICFKNVYIL